MTEMVWIKWKDASYERGEYTKEEVRPGCDIQTAGILIKEDDEFVSLALDHFPGSDRWDPSYRHIVHIPKVNIVKQRRFEVRRT